MTTRTFTAAEMLDKAESRRANKCWCDDGTCPECEVADMLTQAAAASEREAALREEIASYQRTIQQEYDKREALDAEIARLNCELDKLAITLSNEVHNLTAERQKGQALREFVCQLEQGWGSDNRASCYGVVREKMDALGLSPTPTPTTNDDRVIFPFRVTPEFTLGGAGTCVVERRSELADAVCRSIVMSPVGRVTIQLRTDSTEPTPPQGEK